MGSSPLFDLGKSLEIDKAEKSIDPFNVASLKSNTIHQKMLSYDAKYYFPKNFENRSNEKSVDEKAPKSTINKATNLFDKKNKINIFFSDKKNLTRNNSGIINNTSNLSNFNTSQAKAKDTKPDNKSVSN